jgi:hypothetical protein
MASQEEAAEGSVSAPYASWKRAPSPHEVWQAEASPRRPEYSKAADTELVPRLVDLALVAGDREPLAAALYQLHQELGSPSTVTAESLFTGAPASDVARTSIARLPFSVLSSVPLRAERVFWIRGSSLDRTDFSGLEPSGSQAVTAPLASDDEEQAVRMLLTVPIRWGDVTSLNFLG